MISSQKKSDTDGADFYYAGLFQYKLMHKCLKSLC